MSSLLEKGLNAINQCKIETSFDLAFILIISISIEKSVLLSSLSAHTCRTLTCAPTHVPACLDINAGAAERENELSTLRAQTPLPSKFALFLPPLRSRPSLVSHVCMCMHAVCMRQASVDGHCYFWNPVSARARNAQSCSLAWTHKRGERSAAAREIHTRRQKTKGGLWKELSRRNAENDWECALKSSYLIWSFSWNVQDLIAFLFLTE